MLISNTLTQRSLFNHEFMQQTYFQTTLSKAIKIYPELNAHFNQPSHVKQSAV